MGTGKVRYLGKVTGYARGQWIGLEMIEGEFFLLQDADVCFTICTKFVVSYNSKFN
jgi:hypothetical protein